MDEFIFNVQVAKYKIITGVNAGQASYVYADVAKFASEKAIVLRLLEKINMFLVIGQKWNKR